MKILLPKYISCLTIIFCCPILIQAQTALPIAEELSGKVRPYLDLEKKLGSNVFPGKRIFAKTAETNEAIVYRRVESNIPDLLVTYTFTTKDSLLKGIDYEWNPIYFDSIPKDMQPAMQKRMIKKYQELMLPIFRRLGTRDELGNVDDLSYLNSAWGVGQRDKWIYKDTTDIFLTSRFRNQYILPEGDTLRPVNLIRLSLKRIQKLPTITVEELEIPIKQFAGFLKKLKANDLEGSKIFLGSNMAKGIKQPDFDRLNTFIKSEALKGYSGRMECLDGIPYLVVKYVDVEEQPSDFPKILCRVSYNKDNKIVDIVPFVYKTDQRR